MLGKIKTSWSLTKQCWTVLKLDKELLIFPVISTIAVVVLLIGLIDTDFLVFPADESGEINMTQLSAYFVYYFACVFIILFFNTALIACAMIRFRGSDPTIMMGLGAASSRIGSIFMWSLVSATVGLIIKLFGRSDNFLARLAASLFGAIWAVASYFVLPVLIVEGTGPFTAVKRSIAIIRKTWGETLGAEIGMGLIFLVIGIPSWVLFIAAASFQESSIAAYLFFAGLGWMLIAMVMAAAMDGIMRAALFNYAHDGKMLNHFGNEFGENAFKSSK
ncbi:MAG: hypothetical protein ACI8P9_001044 [Parasphingorhabdus sp.]|jgi:hypothetical protein